jgi:hypothetical protein
MCQRRAEIVRFLLVYVEENHPGLVASFDAAAEAVTPMATLVLAVGRQ